MENKKQFAFSVAIEGWNQDTLEFMNKVGYMWSRVTRISNDDYLVNYVLNTNGCYGYQIHSENRILCNWQTEQELCKALLAATTGEMVYDEEYIIRCENNIIIKAGYLINKNISNYPYLRKPQSQELINHFRKPGEASLKFSNSENHTLKLPPVNQNINMVSNSSEPRKIKGYKAPFDMVNYSIKKGEIFIQEDSVLGNYRPKYECKIYLPPEIVEKWEPEYEESVEDKIITAIENHFTTNDRQAYVLAANEIKQLFTNKQYGKEK